MPVTTLIVDRQQLADDRAGDAREEPRRAPRHRRRRRRQAASTTRSTRRTSRCRWRRTSTSPTAVYVTEHRDLFPEIAVTRTAERALPQRLPGRRHARVRRADQRRRSSPPTRATATSASDIIGKTGVEQMFESELRGTPGQRQGRGRQPGPTRSNVVEVKKPRRRPRRAAHRRPRRRSRSPRSRWRRAWTVPRSLVDPDSGNYYAANAGAVVVLERADGSVVAHGLEPELRPQRLHRRQRRPVLQRPEPPADQPGAERLRAGVDVQDVHVAGHAAERPLPRRRRPRRRRRTRRLLHVRERRGALQRGRNVLGCPVDLPIARSRCRATCTSTRWATSSGTATATRDKPRASRATSPATSSPTPSTPSATPSSTPPRPTGSASRPASGSGDQAGVIPNHEYRVKVNPTHARQPVLAPRRQRQPRGRAGRRAGHAAAARQRVRRVRQRRHALPAAPGSMRSPRAAADCPPGQLGPVVHPIDPQVRAHHRA